MTTPAAFTPALAAWLATSSREAAPPVRSPQDRPGGRLVRRSSMLLLHSNGAESRSRAVRSAFEQGETDIVQAGRDVRVLPEASLIQINVAPRNRHPLRVEGRDRGAFPARAKSICLSHCHCCPRGVCLIGAGRFLMSSGGNTIDLGHQFDGRL